MMYIARILYPIKVLGPGNRIGIWFNGCNHKCSGCSNPELWEINEKYRVDINILADLISRICTENKVDGFTLTGGDPFYQPNAINELLPILSNYSKDILVYTGYQFEEIQNKYSDLLKYISVIIDGPYIEERNNGLPLRGSDNQEIIILKKEFEDVYIDYIKNSNNEIQNFTVTDGIISVGIHRPNFNNDIMHMLAKKGISKNE